jgi:hypothetical protein
MKTSPRILAAAAVVALGTAVAPAFARNVTPELRVAFSEGRHHAAVHDVKLDIFNKAGKDVFSLANAGPRADVRLPPGHYRVVAQADGMKRSSRVDIRPGHVARVNMHWPK